MIIWQGLHYIPPQSIQCIRQLLRARLQLRYPLPLEDDDTGIFTGLRIEIIHDTTVGVHPSSPELSWHEDVFDFSVYMHFNSYVPAYIKRSVVLGVVARVERYTAPASAKPAALARLFRLLLNQAEFPILLLRRWSSSTWKSCPWISETWPLLTTISK